MYGNNEETVGGSTSCEMKSYTNFEEPVWDIPKPGELYRDSIYSNGDSKRRENTDGIVNIALDMDEKNDF